MTPTEIINTIRNGKPYTFNGALTGKKFTVSFNGNNFEITTPKGKRDLNTPALETIIFNSLNQRNE